jgi:hypothetical protein
MNYKKVISINGILIMLTIGLILFLVNINIQNNSIISADNGLNEEKKYITSSILMSKIQIALENGKITQIQANEKLAIIQNKSKYQNKNMDMDAIKSKIQIAVENGKITQIQANEKLAIIEKKIK